MSMGTLKYRYFRLRKSNSTYILLVADIVFKGILHNQTAGDICVQMWK